MSEKENDPGKRITDVWLFIAIDSDGDEGLPAITGPGGMMVPMVCTDQKRVDLMRPWARKIARERHCRIELIKFGGARELVETWEP